MMGYLCLVLSATLSQKLKTITFDRFARLLIVVASLVCVYWVFNYLSFVLIPFMVAVVAAYLLMPVCDFLQHTCRLRFRWLCAVLTIVLALAVLAGLLWLCIPPMVSEMGNLKQVVIHYFKGDAADASIPEMVRDFFEANLDKKEIETFMQSGEFTDMLKAMLPGVWGIVSSAATLLINIISSLIALLYLFFLLLDFEHYTQTWHELVPRRWRPAASQLLHDVAYYMCGYFRGQFIIALSNCVMFTIGLLLVGFPMPVALGCFIGIISFVPYLQVLGIVPGALLAMLRAAETGDNFWLLMAGLLAVYIVVQVIQDTVITPHVMGQIMGLSPAVILLTLSIGAAVGGIGGLIMALPVATIGLKYYKAYISRTSAQGPSD